MSDLICRQDAIDALAKFVPYAIDDMSTESYTNGLTDAYNLICQLPSAESTGAMDEAIQEYIKDGYMQPIGEDLISRQNAIEGVKELFACADIGNDECDIIYMLENLPSADRPTGKWVRLEREENVYDLHGVPTWGVNYMCDKCGFITTAIQDHFEQYKFCPHCGKRLVIER